MLGGAWSLAGLAGLAKDPTVDLTQMSEPVRLPKRETGGGLSYRPLPTTSPVYLAPLTVSQQQPQEEKFPILPLALAGLALVLLLKK